VTATIIIAARSFTDAVQYFNPADQLGINDAFITFRLPPSEGMRFKLDVGAFANRYGNMGEYDSGRYGTPIIARIGGVGITGTGAFDLGKANLMLEAGLAGQLNKAPIGVEPAGWNGYLDPNVGTSFVPHVHAGIGPGDGASRPSLHERVLAGRSGHAHHAARRASMPPATRASRWADTVTPTRA
jgi:hypothetical protein